MDRTKEVEEATKELEEALAGVGIVLPSLGPDIVSYTHFSLPPLVELGRCSTEVARRLAAVLRERR
ncbi:hypothetical protein [Streptomyces pinistramenti]|uniref:hypothetical protein n=1 Tax=Streptomyces pinistramenti TaxID=2884812 RepID=UPI001D0698CE|nr:hypothetical protein [Streptomyces pinistramenti]MCB5906819.1 hypothetical protein [Streptomyces pinistramenti]